MGLALVHFQKYWLLSQKVSNIVGIPGEICSQLSRRERKIFKALSLFPSIINYSFLKRRQNKPCFSETHPRRAQWNKVLSKGLNIFILMYSLSCMSKRYSFRKYFVPYIVMENPRYRYLSKPHSLHYAGP